MAAKPALIVFVGGMKVATAPEEMVATARHAAALDSIERALATSVFSRAILVTDEPERGGREPSGFTSQLTITSCRQPFHFGRCLAEVIDRYRVARPLYLGGGALPLLSAATIADLGHQLAESDRLIVTNNYFSADLVGFTPGAIIHAIEPPASDNPLPRLLAEATSLPVHTPPRTPATQFDIDTPIDLLILALLSPSLASPLPAIDSPVAGRLREMSIRLGEFGPRLARYVNSLTLDTSRLQQCLRLFTDPRAQVVVAGRVGSHAWQYLERETACRTRIFSEERGMQADGRYDAGTVRSLLGYYLHSVGMTRFFATLAELGDAAFIDTRVITSHMRSYPSQADRFASDLGLVDAIEDPFLREFTEAARTAPIPVILGGHSLMAGGLMLLVEIAWREHDLALLRSQADSS